MSEAEYDSIAHGHESGLGPISRRDFLKYTGGGIFVFLLAEDSWGAQRGLPSDFNAFLRVGEDGRVTCLTGKIEMGQGIITSLPQMLADELDVSVDSVDIVMGDTSLCPWDGGTHGSMSTRGFGPPLRKAAAEARQVLLELAAEKLDVPVERLQTKDGAVFDPAHTDKKVTYAQLTQGKRIERQLKQEPQLKDVSEFKVIGKSRVRSDARQKVTGKAQYAGDIRAEGMVYAAILRPPAHGAKLRNADTSAAEKRDGVQVIRDNDLIAVLHEKPDVAESALKDVKAEFDIPPAEVDDKTIFQHLLDIATGRGRESQSKGDVDGAAKQAKLTVEKTYYNSYVAHAPTETHSAFAKIENDTVTVWASTQAPFRLQEEIARTLEVSSDKVRVITPFVGGGFGGKGRCIPAVEAARLAKAAKKPVQVVYSRAEEFFYDTFRPAAIVKIKSGLDDSGKFVFWDYGVYFAGDRGAACFYDVPNLRTNSYSETKPGTEAHLFGTGAWRAPSNNTNTFGRESHVDMLAAEARIDPVEFRLKNMVDERMIRVLKAAAEKFGWTPAKRPAATGRGFGVACGIDSGTYVTTMAEVEVNKDTGEVQAKRVVCAMDQGITVNPEGQAIQIEGCIMMGLGYALTEEVHFKGGDILDVNFGSYKLPRFSWLPEIEAVLVENKDLTPQGGGEPAVITMGAVIANAVFDATGARLFQLPMTGERIKEAISKSV